MERKPIIPKIIDWVLICIAVALLIYVCVSGTSATYGHLSNNEQPSWYFGEGLNMGDSFQYEICDSILKIPESPEPCYTITLQFLQLLPSPEGNTWVTSVHVIHNSREIDMIFHIIDASFKVKTDGMSIPYAQSIERTLGWIKQHASKFEPRQLKVGKVWGTIASPASNPTELLLAQIDSFHLENQTHNTYKLAYHTAKESLVQIKDEFPFPMHAIVYKPISSHPDTPLAFKVRLLAFWNENLCYLPHHDDIITPVNEPVLQNFVTTNDTSQHEESLDDSNSVFDILSAEHEIEEIDNASNDENQTLIQDYEKIEEFFGNFTGFLQILTDKVNQIIQNQTK